MIHPEYDRISMINNVALIKTIDDIRFSSAVQPSTLRTTETGEYEKVYAIGWNNTNQEVCLNET